MKTGRPSTYKPELADKLIKFFDIEPYEEIRLPHYDKDGKTIKWEDIKRLPRKLPTLRAFAKSINIPISTIYDWLAKDHASFQKEFSDAFTHAKEIRKEFLIENALQGMYNPLTFKFVAVNLTDLKDVQEVISDLHIHINEKFKGKRGHKH